MNENKSVPAVGKTAVQPLYSHPYYAKDGKLYIEKQSKSGLYLEQLCNFTPRIVSEVTFDDGQTCARNTASRRCEERLMLVRSSVR